MQQKCDDMEQMQTRGITVIWISSNIMSLLSVPRNCFLYYTVMSCNNIKNLEENIPYHVHIASISVANWNNQGKIAPPSPFSSVSQPTSSSYYYLSWKVLENNQYLNKKCKKDITSDKKNRGGKNKNKKKPKELQVELTCLANTMKLWETNL